METKGRFAVFLIKIRGIPIPLISLHQFFHNPCGISLNNCIRGNIPEHDRSCPDHGFFPDGHPIDDDTSGKNICATTNVNPGYGPGILVVKRRRNMSMSRNDTAITNPGFVIDRDIFRIDPVKEHVAPNIHIFPYLDSLRTVQAHPYGR